MAHEAGILNAVQQHIGDAEHVRELLLFDGTQGFLHVLLVLDLFYVALAHVAHGASEESAGAAGGVQENFARVGVDAVRHEGGDGARGVILAGIAGALQVVEDLLVDVAEMLPLGEVIEVHLVDLVHDLPHELAGLHVVVGVLEYIAHHPAAVALLSCGREFLELREELGVDEGEEFVAGDALGVGRPGPPPEFLRDGRAVAVLHQLKLLILVVDDLEKEHPAQLRDALGIAIDAAVLAHDVLYRFDGLTNGHIAT